MNAVLLSQPTVTHEENRAVVKRITNTCEFSSYDELKHIL